MTTERSNADAAARSAGGRPAQPEPFLRGCAWPAGAGVAYPRADPRDMSRLPVDTWGTAQLPVGVRLELVAGPGAAAVEIAYRTHTDDFGYRGPGAGTTFAAYAGEALLGEEKAELGAGTVRLPVAPAGVPTVVYLPEGMKPVVESVEGVGGAIEPAPVRSRWLCYGDSIAEGWIASGPAGSWPAIVGRCHDLDVVNLGYAGAARGEIVSAEQLGALREPAPAVISITHGTNCWTRIPHSAAQMEANTAAFLAVVRAGHPVVPIVVCSPVLRPDAESTPNKLGATLGDLRAAMERATRAAHDGGDALLTLVSGNGVLDAGHLADGIHPGDDGHRRMADVFGAAIARAARAAPARRRRAAR